MQRKFFSSLFLLVALNGLIKPVWLFGIDRQVQNIAGTGAYGAYFALFNLSIILNFLLDAGLTTFYNQAAAADTAAAKENLFRTGTFKLLLGTVYGLALVAIGLLAGISNWQLLLLLGFNQFLFSLFLFLRGAVTALQLFKTDAWLSVLDKLLMILTCGTLIYFPAVAGPISIYKFVVLQTAAVAIAIVVAAFILMRHHRQLFTQQWVIDLSLLKKALPFGIIVLLMSVHNRADSFLLERMHPNGAYETGIYARAFRLWDAANMVGVLVTGFLLPYIAKNYTAGIAIKSTIRWCSCGLLFFNAVVAAGCIIFSQPLQKLLYHSNDAYSANVIALYLVSLAGYALVQVYGTLLTATGHIPTFIKISLPFMALNILLNIFFIIPYGALGCCIISIITQSLYGIAVWLAARQKIAC